jgi:transcriptional regulator with XRE-family HTH domain
VVEFTETGGYIREMTGADIKKLRESLGLSQRQFAKKLGVSNMMISRAEARGPEELLILKIERAMRRGDLGPSEEKIKPE